MTTPPSLTKLFRVWLSIGIQSFGGGTTTMVLIRRSAVDTHGWITDQEFNRYWSLCQMTPGINLIGLTIVIGKQIAGWRGILICLAGMLLPSAFITALLTAGFLAIRDLPVVKGALAGILPATVGLGLVTAFQMGQQPIKSSYDKGWGPLLFAFMLLGGSAAALWTGRTSVTVVLIAASLAGAIENVLAKKWRARK